MPDDPFSATRAATEAAIQQVDEHADEVWKAAALAAVIWCARHYTTFTADEVWDQLDMVGIPGPRTPSALGPIFLQAKRAGAIQSTDRWQPLSRFPRRHRALRIWFSLVHGDPTKQFELMMVEHNQQLQARTAVGLFPWVNNVSKRP
jgi:hypothetical protein